MHIYIHIYIYICIYTHADIYLSIYLSIHIRMYVRGSQIPEPLLTVTSVFRNNVEAAVAANFQAQNLKLWCLSQTNS